MPTPHAMFRILSVTCLLTRKLSIAFNYYPRLVLGSDGETQYVILSKYNQNCLFSHVLHVEQFCINTVYIIRMSFSTSNNFIIVVTVVVPRVFVVFCRHVHLDPDIRVHRGTENSFIINPRRACAERVTVVILCVCMYVCHAHAILAVRAIKSVTKDTVMLNVIFAPIL